MILRKESYVFVLLFITILSCFPVGAMAQDDPLAEANELNTRAIKLYQAGHYDQAIPLAERALAIREKALEAGARETPGYPLLSRAIKAGARTAIAIAKRI